MSKTLFVQIVVGVLMASIFLVLWGLLLAVLMWVVWPLLLTIWWFFTSPWLCLFFGVAGVIGAIAFGLIGGGVYAAAKAVKGETDVV